MVYQSPETISMLLEKARDIRRQTLKIHKIASGTRIASSLSDVELFVALFYGGVLRFDPKNIHLETRDRLIVSKGHGAISMYPILADLGYFAQSELERVCMEGTYLGSIPDTAIPGFETINGSLGLGLGVACGMAIALKNKKSDSKVFVLSGDGELFIGAVWEAIMFAAQHRLDNLVLIVDLNKRCMLDYCDKIIDLAPIEEKFRVFKWRVETVDGHDMEAVYSSLTKLRMEQGGQPKVLIANTIKGKGVPRLEVDPLAHIRSLSGDEVDEIISRMQD